MTPAAAAKLVVSQHYDLPRGALASRDRTRAAEIARLKAECDRCISSGHWELAESYHRKLIELEILG